MKRIFGILALALLAVPAWANPNTFQVTIGSSATVISSTPLYCHYVVFQNNAANQEAVGDASVSVTGDGAQLASGSPGGSFTTPVATDSSPYDLSQWYVAGTSGDKINVTCEQVNF